jgi:glutathione synthase/RimK-type ligase-like ATP-grasp enzyme
MIYQPYIDKIYEVRLTVIGKKLFATRIDSQTKRKTVDWRYDLDDGKDWPLRIDCLPEEIERAVRGLVSQLKLELACIDLICTPHNEWYFLEVNEQGQFLWLEEALPQQRLLQSMCELLLGSHQNGKDLHFEDYINSNQYSNFRNRFKHAAQSQFVTVE